MANICTNDFYAFSNNYENLKYIADFLDTHFDETADVDGEFLYAIFESKWTFPEELMEDLYNNLPDKDDIYMRCLSYEFGNEYHELMICDENGWQSK
jgi:hypothetical protein